MAELKGVYKNAYSFAQQYAYIINNGVANSFRTPLSSVCEDIIRIYDLDVCDYMKYFQLDGVKLFFLFTKEKKDIYRTIKYCECIFVVVPVTSLFETLDNETILNGVLQALHVILNFVNVMKYGSPTDIYKAIFASYYFMIYVFVNCYDLDDKVKKSIHTVIDAEFGDLCKADDVIKALTSVREEKVDENTADLFMNHKVLSYMDNKSLEILTSE